MKNTFLSLFLVFSLPTMVFSQQQIPLYPNGVPGLKKNSEAKEVDINKTDDGVQRIRNVVDPVLYVYSPKNKTSDAAVIICPGGGYYILALNHEGFTPAEWFAEHGVTAFVLKYRLPQGELFDNPTIRPLEDAQQALRMVRKMAEEYDIHPQKIGMMGFSAGGHLASTAATHFLEKVGEFSSDTTNVRPDFSILLYPVITFKDKITHEGSRLNLIGEALPAEGIQAYSNELHVSLQTPPTFLVHAFDDGVAVENSLLYMSALKENKVPSELHIYDRGGHGFSFTKKGRGPVETWPDRLADWMKKNEWMK